MWIKHPNSEYSTFQKPNNQKPKKPKTQQPKHETLKIPKTQQSKFLKHIIILSARVFEASLQRYLSGTSMGTSFSSVSPSRRLTFSPISVSRPLPLFFLPTPRLRPTCARKAVVCAAPTRTICSRSAVESRGAGVGRLIELSRFANVVARPAGASPMDATVSD